jgi:hypothetical protein
MTLEIVKPSPTSVREQRIDALQTAVDACKQRASFYEKEGLTPLSFYTGLMNVGLTGFVVGYVPQHFWIPYFFKCSILTVVAFRTRWRDATTLYFCDFCWVVTLCNLLWLGAALLTAYGVADFAWLTASPVVFRAIFTLSCGPLGLAVFILQSALVMHDAVQMAGLAIHLSPYVHA